MYSKALVQLLYKNLFFFTLRLSMCKAVNIISEFMIVVIWLVLPLRRYWSNWLMNTQQTINIAFKSYAYHENVFCFLFCLRCIMLYTFNKISCVAYLLLYTHVRWLMSRVYRLRTVAVIFQEPERDCSLMAEITTPTTGAKIGKIARTIITIVNDDGK